MKMDIRKVHFAFCQRCLYYLAANLSLLCLESSEAVQDIDLCAINSKIMTAMKFL